MTTDIIGFGMTFARESATPGTFTPAAGVIDVTPPTETRDAKEGTNHGSPNGYREYIGGLLDGGTAKLVLSFDPAVSFYTNLKADMKNRLAHGYKIGLPNDGYECSFDGLVTELGPATPMEDRITCTVSIKVSGEPVWAEAE